MASSSLHSNLSFFSSSTTKRHTFITTTTRNVTIHCGPRDNRGPIQKGRILSIEAIQAIQALKRAKSDETKLSTLISKTLTRLVKNDLISSLNELLRQNHCDLALKVFSTVRSELWYKTDCSLYADMVSALARNGMLEDIDRLILDLEKEGLGKDDSKGISKIIKALIAAERKECVVRIYGVMKKDGWVCRNEKDEYVVKVLSRGLRRLGEGDVADEVEKEYGSLSEGKLEKSIV
ncbi:Thylakoid assembly 8 protein [Thalictrum thalictroides]|uniref:Thylakoid assembly 8 protein n=1 Tax=Thalictrum thalictroides TaxID=46969 RepID=A0A7J6W0T5_THATH|nr:Thylakoid assembly 8 protein [Thalictrum thalictroides]